MTTSVIRALFGLALGLGLCVGLVLWLGVRAEDAAALAHGLSWLWVGGIFILSFVLMGSGAYKWALWSRLIHGEDSTPSSFYWRHYIWQGWASQFVPPSLAIILGRGWAERRAPKSNAAAKGSFRHGAVSGLWDQAVEFAFLCAFVPGAVLVFWGEAGVDVFVGLGFVFTLIAGALLYLIGIHKFPERRGLVLWLLGWSVVRVLLTLTRLIAGAPALSIAISWLHIGAASALVSMLAVVPLTPGNLGITEWGWVGVLALGGAKPMDAALLALGFRLVILAMHTLLVLLCEGVFLVRKISLKSQP